MPSQLTHESIASSLFTHWADQFPLSVTTIYPGTKVDTTGLNEWLELSIEEWFRRPQRSGGKQVIDVSVVVHCFVKQGLDKSRLHELADAARSTISQKTIAIRDYDMSGTPVLGYLNMVEPNTRDRTRDAANALRHTMQHLEIRCLGFAQQI